MPGASWPASAAECARGETAIDEARGCCCASVGSAWCRSHEGVATNGMDMRRAYEDARGTRHPLGRWWGSSLLHTLVEENSSRSRSSDSAVNERGRHPLGGTGAASAAQGLGGITSAAGHETSVRAVFSVGLPKRCASIFVLICADVQFSLRKGTVTALTTARKSMRPAVTDPLQRRRSRAVWCWVGQATQPMHAIAKERPENHDRSDRPRTRGDQALPPEPRIRRPSRRRRPSLPEREAIASRSGRNRPASSSSGRSPSPARSTGRTRPSPSGSTTAS